MTLSIPTEESVFDQDGFEVEPSKFQLTTRDQEDNKIRNDPLRLKPLVENENQWFFQGNRPLELKDCWDKIEPFSFSPNNPWLPPSALKLLSKMKEGYISENELVKLMETVAERATDHFGLSEGQFVALTFNGRVVEVSDTRVGLLKKLQSRNSNSLFVWRIGFKAFSGRL